ncbi:MAG: hypothetical protein Q9165_005213 [Trypethelium subeluteriae]
MLTATISFTREDASKQAPKLLLAQGFIPQLTIDQNFYGFTPLYEPSQPSVEIVAVTGLAGHAYGSWATKDDHAWLLDDLPYDIKDAWILLYGYPSELLKHKMKSHVMDHATEFLQRLRALRASNGAIDRPIVLIGHSLGCLIIKQAIIDDAEREDQSNRLPITCIVFLGAPHRGLDVRSLETLVAAKPPENLIRELKPGSPTLNSLNARFSRVANRVSIITCYEKLPTPTVQQEPNGSWKRSGPEVMMVSEDSALLYLPNEIRVSANSNHSDIAKIRPGETGIYHHLVHNIRLALSSVQDKALPSDYKVSSSSQGSPTSWTNPSLRANRNQELQNKHEEEQKWVKSPAQNERTKTFLQKLYTCPYRDRKDRNCERTPGTCEWFTSHPHFQNWNKNQGPCLLWVSADPGCGKSILTKYLIDQVLPCASKRTTCYFFFKDDFPDQRKVANAICAMLRQLLLEHPRLLQDWMLKELDIGGDHFVQSFRDLWSMFTTVATNPDAGEIVCVLDALDECQDEDRFQLIQAVGKLYVDNPKDFKLRFLLTSRPYDHLRREFRGFENDLPTIHLSGEDEAEVEKISDEIDLVIKSRVWDSVRKRELKHDEGIFLQEQLLSVDRRHRTYLWVHLTLDVIENMPGFTRGNVRRAIRQLPPTVDDAYEKILGRSPDKEKARKLLHIVTAATRPLSLDEVSIMMAIEETHKSYDDVKQEIEPEERFRFTLRDLCGLIVVIVGREIYLLHQTVKEFLIRDDSSALSTESLHTWKHSLRPKTSNRILAETCVWYLTSFCFETDLSALLNYSALNWMTHFSKANIRSEEAIVVSARRLCEKGSKQFNEWSIIWGLYSSGSPLPADPLNIASYFPETANPLIIASFLGFDALVKLLLDTGKVEIDSKDDKLYQTPLSWAAERGYEAVVKLLLETGEAEVDSRNGADNTPLSLAVSSGHKVIVKLLLETGKVEVDLRNRAGNTPLSLAASIGHEVVVKLLLETGKVEADSKNGAGDTPLSRAARYGHEAVVKLLLETGKVEADSRNRAGDTPLSLAARYGHEAVVKLLLETGKVEADSRNRAGNTPLSLAACYGHEVVVKLLLETGKVEADSRNRAGDTPLSLTARHGHEVVVKLLLETGRAKVDSKDIFGWTPLSLAAEEGHEAVVKLLQNTMNAVKDGRRLRPLPPKPPLL